LKTTLQNNPERLSLEEAPTLAALFRARVKRSGECSAYRQYDSASDQWRDHSWNDTAREVSRWQQALRASGLKRGDRVMIMCHNAWEWVICDQATLGMGLVLVPLFMNDRAENIAWIANDCGAALLVIEGEAQWQALEPVMDQLETVRLLVALKPFRARHPRLKQLAQWLPDTGGPLAEEEGNADALATIVYTSGTTGRPKGVMLSHHNILWNIHAALQLFEIGNHHLFLSFLPLSHTFERTVGYYLPMVCGCTIAYNRSIPQLAEDLARIRPTLLISVPRIFERIYGRIMDKLRQEPPLKQKLFLQAIETGWRKFEHQQGRARWSPRLLLHPLLDRLVGARVRARLGGRLHFTVCGGAALSPEVARLFIGLGIPVQQGYGLTETSPVIAANPLENNIPSSVGLPLPGVEIKLGEGDELLTRSPSVMLGYWNNPEATAEMIDSNGWLHTGDRARIDTSGHIHITGRLKEIIVLATGEKVPPADMENAIVLDPLIEQAMVVGEGKPYLAALVVLNPAAFRSLAEELGLDPTADATLQDERLEKAVLTRVRHQTSAFPGYARINRVAILHQPLTPENGLLTPTLKLRRNRILQQYSNEMAALYTGH
jgi:long-chain acyl-CoA synthetase